MMTGPPGRSRRALSGERKTVEGHSARSIGLSSRLHPEPTPKLERDPDAPRSSCAGAELIAGRVWWRHPHRRLNAFRRDVRFRSFSRSFSRVMGHPASLQIDLEIRCDPGCAGN